jgi:hypothetical protein
MAITVGTERIVNATTTGSQILPEITQLGSGKLLEIWLSFESNTKVRARALRNRDRVHQQQPLLLPNWKTGYRYAIGWQGHIGSPNL